MTDSSFSSLSASCCICRMMNLNPFTGASNRSSIRNISLRRLLAAVPPPAKSRDYLRQFIYLARQLCDVLAVTLVDEEQRFDVVVVGLDGVLERVEVSACVLGVSFQSSHPRIGADKTLLHLSLPFFRTGLPLFRARLPLFRPHVRVDERRDSVAQVAVVAAVSTCHARGDPAELAYAFIELLKTVGELRVLILISLRTYGEPCHLFEDEVHGALAFFVGHGLSLIRSKRPMSVGGRRRVRRRPRRAPVSGGCGRSCRGA